jgi:hypothetical protein
MNTDNRYVFSTIIIVAVGIAILVAIASLFLSRPEPEPEMLAPVQYGSLDTYELSDNGYIGWSNENPDWCDRFINFSHDDIQITGQVGDDYIEIFLRDTSTGVMARIAGDNVSGLEMEIK